MELLGEGVRVPMDEHLVRAGGAAEVVSMSCAARLQPGGRPYLLVSKAALRACVCILQELLKHQRGNMEVLESAEDKGRCLKVRDWQSSVCVAGEERMG